MVRYRRTIFTPKASTQTSTIRMRTVSIQKQIIAITVVLIVDRTRVIKIKRNQSQR